MSGSHAHHHHHHGHDAGQRVGRAFAIGIALNLAYVVVEAGIGLWQGSLALLADAGHNLSDVLGLGLAWGAASLGRVPPSSRFTYGLRSTTIWAALANALLLLVACGAIALEAVRRFGAPAPVDGGLVAAVAGIGIVVNGATAALFLRDRHRDLNVKGAYLHMVADAAVSLGVVVSGLVMMRTGWSWLDPAVSIAIVAAIFVGTWGLLKDSLRLALHAVPRGIDADEVRRFLKGLDGVAEVHDLHIWSMSTTDTALTAHLVAPAGHPATPSLRMRRTNSSTASASRTRRCRSRWGMAPRRAGWRRSTWCEAYSASLKRTRRLARSMRASIASISCTGRVTRNPQMHCQVGFATNADSGSSADSPQAGQER